MQSSDVSFPEAVRQTIAVNYYGLLRVTNTFLPLLQPHGRIIHMSSGLGNIKHVGQKWKEAVLNPDLTEEGLTQIMDQFVEDAQKEDYSTRGWPIHQSGDRCRRVVHSTSTFRLYIPGLFPQITLPTMFPRLESIDWPRYRPRPLDLTPVVQESSSMLCVQDG
jgi:hypothetical protein